MRPRLVIMPAAYAALALALVSLIALAFAQTRRDKPRVPPGVDPGGVTIAIIGSGIDYTRPEIAARLARDGEGELVGWDFVDNDRRPFEDCAQSVPPRACGHDLIGPLLGTRPRLIPLRVASDRPDTLVGSIQAASTMPTRIVLLLVEPLLPIAFIEQAAHRFPKLAFIGIAPDIGPIAKRGDNYVGIPAGGKVGDARIAGAYFASTAIMCATRSRALDAAGITKCAFEQPPAQ
jgi:subtilisin family serine protease